MWLQEDGRDVQVLEGAQRVGGRLHTLDHGKYGRTEAGGEQIGASYARLRNRADTLEVALIEDASTPRGTTYALGGKLYSPEDWKRDNPAAFPVPYAGASPGAALFRAAGTTNPFSNADDWRMARNDNSAHELLTTAGFGPGQRSVIAHALNANALETYSAANLWRSLQLYSQSRGMGAGLSVEGGAQALPKAMAASLERPVELGAHIAGIVVAPDSVTVTCEDGRVFRAPHAICALPFGALRHIALDAPVSATQREAITALPYTQIVQLHFRVTAPFWEDGLPADMWTDTPFERVFMQRGNNGSPTGLGRCWINGAGAGQVDLSGFAQAMARIRPSMADAIIPLEEVFWTKADPLSGGAYMHFAPGHISRWAAKMGAPAGRLHFAGEHLGLLHTGMEAAMESGEAAAFALMGV